MVLHVALVSRTSRLDFDELSVVAAALQKQVLRDWTVTIERFSGGGGFAGIHGDENFQPFARVALTNTWSLTASHEVIEMLTDPFRNEMKAGALAGDPGRQWRQLIHSPGAAAPVTVPLTIPVAARSLSLREQVDRAATRPAWWVAGLPADGPHLARCVRLYRGVRRAGRRAARARRGALAGHRRERARRSARRGK